MYWYLSFLRPPPVFISLPADSVTITPQVANDLRTEIRDHPTEISYIWQKIFPTIKSPQQPVHLTTFINPTSTYKPLSISLPKSIKIGEKWRLGLVASSPGSSEQLLLDVISDKPEVLGVWSEAIEVRRSEVELNGNIHCVGHGKKVSGANLNQEKEMDKHKGKGRVEGPKQNRICREWVLPDQLRLRIIEQTSYDLDKKIWDSGLALASWLWQHLPAVSSNKKSEIHPLAVEMLLNIVSNRTNINVIEIGSGTGIVSIALAKALRACKNQEKVLSTENDMTAVEEKSQVVSFRVTDLPSAMELMRENIELNMVSTLNSKQGKISLQAEVLDWDEELPSWAENSNLLIAADVSYNTASFPSLAKTIDRMMKPSTDFLFAYKKRDDSERDLWSLLEERGIWLTLVDVVQGSEDYGQVEIWFGSRNRDEKYEWGWKGS